MKKAIAVLILVVLVFSLTGCCLKHEWKDATCTEPKTCAKCGKTEGEPTGHDWKEATCAEPKTCLTCGETEGEPTGHLHTEWKEENLDILNARRELSLVCDDCGKKIDSKTENVDSFIDGNVFIFTAKEFVERMQMFYDELNGKDLPLKFVYSINKFGAVNFDVYNQYDYWLAWGIFYDTEGQSLKAENEDGKINCVAIFAPEQEELSLEVVHYLLTLLTNAASKAIDPQITDFNVYSEPVMNNEYVAGEGKLLHGLTYSFSLADNEFKLYIEIPTE